MSGNTSLTETPTNLKEAIDWLALVGRGFGGNIDKGWLGEGKQDELAKALKQLDGFKDFTACCDRHFTRGSLSDVIYIFAQGLGSGFLGYNGRNSDTSSGETYKSSYHACHWDQNDEPTYARIFLFLACLVFYFITFLYWMCYSGGPWANKMTYSDPVDTFLREMGYDPSQLNWNKQGSEIAKHLDGSQGSDAFPELQAAYQKSSASSSYNVFLRQLETNVSIDALLCPLTNCKICSYEYLKSRRNGADVTAAIHAVKGELVNLSTKNHISSTGNFSDLKQKVQNLLDKIQSFDPNPAPSPVAPIASALTTLTAAGGAGAAYGLNLFGLQSVVKALFGFK
ncbi:variant erythrocyte surface antigen-1 family protein [Babesia caballi]|uniref:Variant erythrocyte surface antigen-1 family protein n=1 Tax=Babesia caballi TaxID=5871 RepID=A0AAV4LYQ1_BABCB|nr:variant erythrocyte surface antigen-1 family protein [Babesia caballi]